jgi:hypothetical protein
MIIDFLKKHLIPKSKKSSRALLRELNKNIQELRDLFLISQTRQAQINHINPLNRFGLKCFSQTDEDGITLEILRRIKSLGKGVFAEFGVGDGTENNTLILKAMGWKGFWVGFENLKINYSANQDNFIFIKKYITLENIAGICKDGLKKIGCKEIDLISLDLDGNDFYFIESILNNRIKPKVFIIEYNAKFPPPIRWKMPYNSHHSWNTDDYFGASISSFSELFEGHGYKLICCNSQSGSNAFFIRNDFYKYFKDVPKKISEIYVPPNYYSYKQGHRQSEKTIDVIFK